jgi:type IV pilus assembly protein PilA
MKALRGEKGFTLIELLIVIIIIGILAAIAIPMFLSQREKAKDSAVKGAVHNIELGVGAYGIDHGDVYPPTGSIDFLAVSYVDNWPKNPWTDANMTTSTSVGDYTYTRAAGGNQFSLAGHLSNGDFVVP